MKIADISGRQLWNQNIQIILYVCNKLIKVNGQLFLEEIIYPNNCLDIILIDRKFFKRRIRICRSTYGIISNVPLIKQNTV